MEKLEAVKKLLGRLEIGTKTIAYEYDPAGSDREVVPSPEDLKIVEALVGRPITETDLLFSVRCGPYADRFTLRDEVLAEVSLYVPMKLAGPSTKQEQSDAR